MSELDPFQTSVSTAKKADGTDKKMMGGSFAVSLVIHAVILLIVGSIVIVPAAMEKLMPVTSVAPPPMEIPEPPPLDEAVGDPMEDAGTPIGEVKEVSNQDPQEASDLDALVVDSTATATPRLNSIPAGAGTLDADAFAARASGAGGSGGSGGGSGRGIGRKTFFGATEKVDSTLIGRFYDLKQTPQRQPTGVGLVEYLAVIQNFVNQGWNESVLRKYYRAKRPLYASQFWAPTIRSEMAAEAFEVQNEVQGSYWVAHYRGRVVPPRDGTYRFVGFADCQMVVGVNRQLALVSSYWKDKPHFDFPECPLVGDYRAGEGGLRAGPWLELKASKPIDLDVLWGDNGGVCSAFLMIEEKNGHYKSEKGQPILPIFQLSLNKVDASSELAQPKFATGFPAWKGVQ